MIVYQVLYDWDWKHWSPRAIDGAGTADSAIHDVVV